MKKKVSESFSVSRVSFKNKPILYQRRGAKIILYKADSFERIIQIIERNVMHKGL